MAIFKIERIDGNKISIIWVMDFDNMSMSGELDKTFQFGDSVCTTTFKLSFNYEVVTVKLDANGKKVCDVKCLLSLTPNLSENAAGDGEASNKLCEIYNGFHRPRVVEFMSNRITYFMKKSDFAGTWKSNTLNFEYPCHTRIELRPLRTRVLETRDNSTDDDDYDSDYEDLPPSTSVISIKKLMAFKVFIQFTDTIYGPNKALKHLAELYSEQEYCDVQFFFEDDTSIGGHKCILTQIPVFAAMFKHDMKESRTGRVDIKDIEKNIFEEMLHYIYSGRMKNLLQDVDTAMSLYTAADKYDIEDLKEECVNYLVSDIQMDNVHGLFIWSKTNSAKEVYGKVITFMLEHNYTFKK